VRNEGYPENRLPARTEKNSASEVRRERETEEFGKEGLYGAA